MTWHKLLFILTAFVGVILLAIQDYQHIFAWGNGEVLALVSTFSFALSYVASRWRGTLLNNKEITTIILGIGALMVFLTPLIVGEGVLWRNSYCAECDWIESCRGEEVRLHDKNVSIASSEI